MRRCLAGAKLIEHRYEHLYHGELTEEVFRVIKYRSTTVFAVYHNIAGAIDELPFFVWQKKW
jgi:hypothetical protein